MLVMDSLVVDGQRVDVTRLGSGSSRKGSASRWNEVTIYRAPSGYIVRNLGRSTLAGETDREQLDSAADVNAVIAVLRRGRERLSFAALAALAEAAEADRAFARDYQLAEESALLVRHGDALRDVPPAPGSMVVTLPRTNMLPLRFHGRTLALESTRTPSRKEWNEVVIFAVDGEGYAVGSYGMILGPDDGEPAYDLARARASIVTTGREAIDVLAVDGGLQKRAWQALVTAAAADPVFAATLGRWHERAYARVPALCVNPDVASGYAGTHFSGIPIARAQADGVRTRIYRTHDPLDRRYIALSRAIPRPGTPPARAYDRWRGSLEDLVTTFPADLVRQCATRDRDVAAAIGLSLAPSDDDCEGDDLCATRPRESLHAMPPAWPLV